MADYSKLDPIQIQRITFDQESESIKVKMFPMEMAMELSADDGDSIIAVPQMQVIEAEAEQVIDTSKAKRMNVICDHPVDCDMIVAGQVISLGTVSGIKEICSPAVQVGSACIVILQS